MTRSILAMAAATILVTVAGISTSDAAAPADLRIRVTSASFKVGENGVFRVSLRNESPVDADGTIRITIALPEGLSFVSGNDNGWSCAAARRDVVCEKDGLDASRSTGFTLTVAVCTAAYPVTSVTFRTIYDPDPSLGNNETTRLTAVKAGTCADPSATPTRHGQFTVTPTRTPTPSPRPRTGVELLLTGSSSRMVVVGGTATYRFRISNLGETATSTRIQFVDTLPEGLSFAGAAGDGWTCQANAQVVTCDRFRPLPGGEDSDLSVTVDVGSDAFPTVTNEAAIFYVGDRNTGNNRVSRPTTVRKPQRRPHPIPHSPRD